MLPHVLKRDMRCWKVLYRDYDDMLYSVVLNKNYELGRLYTEEGEPEVLKDETCYCDKTTYSVYGGYMHAFTSVKRAKWERNEYSNVEYFDGRTLVICECTIPAGTEVYTDRKNLEICARSLRVNKIVKL